MSILAKQILIIWALCMGVFGMTLFVLFGGNTPEADKDIKCRIARFIIFVIILIPFVCLIFI